MRAEQLVLEAELAKGDIILISLAIKQRVRGLPWRKEYSFVRFAVHLTTQYWHQA